MTAAKLSASRAARLFHAPLQRAPTIVAQLNSRFRVTVCAGNVQWVLESKKGTGPTGWRGESYCATRAALIRAIGERAGPVDAAALQVVHALPDHIRDSV